MLLTVSKRLEFSASRRLFDPSVSQEENEHRYGNEARSRYGTGRNYVAWFTLTGETDPATGMLANISEIKTRAQEIIDAEFDHKFLNEDNPHFVDVVPTAENVAQRLFDAARSRFDDLRARLAAVHLEETTSRSATCFQDGTLEANYWIDFSAARRTVSPLLSSAENVALFGEAAGIHGHHYRARFTFRELPKEAQALAFLDAMYGEVDHKDLNNDVPFLRDEPITTERIAQLLLLRAGALRPHRVRLYERDDFFAEAWDNGSVFLGMRDRFSAVHRLHAPSLSAAENSALFGKCNNPRGHGHTYTVEATIGGDFHPRTGTLHDFKAFRQTLHESLGSWRDKHLDLETDEFQQQPSTGENIVEALWAKLGPALGNRLMRLRIWETANNRFTLRRTELP